MKIKLIILIISLILLITSCADNPSTPSDNLSTPPDIPPAPIEREYVSTDITYSESTAQYGFRLNMDATETQFAKYYFEESVKEEERESCIKTTDDLLSSQLCQSALPEIYIFSQDRYGYKYIDNHKLYSPIQDWKSVEYITDILLVAYGEQSHYGTAFGYANYLAKNHQWDSYSCKLSSPSVNDLFDLNYLCFDENFTAINDIAIVKAIACDFVDSYIDQYGEQEIKQLMSSHSNSIDALTTYYAENGVSYIPSTIQYGYGGKSYDYLVFSDFGTFHIANDWVDIHAELNPLITDGFLHSDYSDTKAFFETNLEQMNQYQKLFELNDYNNGLDIIFPKSISASQNSFYHSTDHRIYLYNVDSLMHEYIHALTQPKYSMRVWEREGFARYFSYYYDFYGMPFLNQDYNNSPNTPELKYIHEYLATINRPIDMEKDFCELENVAVHYFNFTNPNANYLAGSSFVQYLVKQYGEEAVINSIYGNGDPLPKTYAELVKEWNEFIESNYKSYSKYK